MAPFFVATKQYQVTSPEPFKRNYHRKSPSQSTSSYSSNGKYIPRCDTPGPGSYRLPSPDVYKRRSPSFSMSERTHRSIRNETPGPGAYSPEKVWINKRSAPRYTFGIRHSPFVAPTHRLETNYNYALTDFKII